MRNGLVTILVFLAALLQLKPDTTILVWVERYNPCFSGSSIATKQTRNSPRRSDQVTILVFLAALLQQHGNTRRPRRADIVTILVFLAALLQQQQFFSNR